MEPHSDKTDAQQRENPDPTESGRPVPFVVVAVVVLTIACALFYIVWRSPNDPSELGDSRQLAELAGTKPAAGASGSANGAQIFAANCAACHQATGAGLPGVFPPLAGSERANSAAVLPINIVLHGINGKITTKAGAFAGTMPSFKDKFSDDEIAAVLTYVRSNFGNASDKISADEVKTVREASKDRTASFSGDDELAAVK